MLISRTWHGAVPLEHGDAFASYLEKTGIQGSRSIPGNAAAYVHRVEQDGYLHFFLCTMWFSWEAVRAFAGEPPEVAVTYPEDAKYELISDPIVIHLEVTTDQNPFERFFHSGCAQG
jgi:heme-degrading monooxygenase HmoA